MTFALLHPACMRVIAAVVPLHLAATAQSIYAAGVTATVAVLTLVPRILYARLGAGAFLVMAVLCVVAVPATGRLASRRVEPPA